MKFSDGIEATMEQKEKWELDDAPINRKCVLFFLNGEEYTGIYKGLEGSDIMLESLLSKNLIGLPWVKLTHFLLEVFAEADA